MTIAHKGGGGRGKGNCGVLLDLLTSPDLLTGAKMQFEQNTKEIKYFFYSHPVPNRRWI